MTSIMHTLQNTIRLAPLAAVLLTTAFATPAAASPKPLKIHGSLESFEVQTVAPPQMLVELEGTGRASHLGRFRLTGEAVVFLPTSVGEGIFEIETACGSKLQGTTTGQGFPTPDSNLAPVEETLTITGGTGRFQGATGTLYIDRVLDRVTKISTGTIKGTIDLPPPSRCRRGR